MRKPHVIAGKVYAQANVNALPDRITGREAAAARAAAFSLAAITSFSHAIEARKRRDQKRAVACVRLGQNLDTLARDIDRKGCL